MRMIRAFVGGRKLTAQQLMEILSDVPQATLYRHLNKLLNGGLLAIIQQRQVRGAVERVYALAERDLFTPLMDDQELSCEDYMEHFLAFLAILQSDYQRYLQQEKINLKQDGVEYRQFHLNLSDEEYQQFMNKMNEIIQEALDKLPSPKRRSRTLSTLVIPEPL
ncbi:transcriptional regulator [Thermoflavimicrobium daqui]|uniref:Transcriptional regulator n=2 Tax=Thermoflavimicrobium daqui TaxID=2137476 RepID=A0A364K5J0_9BACL|nr:transcriptional regulator [Thermoflavimicrobium daqui]